MEKLRIDRMDRMAVKTLYIDRWESRCGDCERSVDPMALICSPFNREPPCDTRPYENLSSHYYGMEDSVIPMRPDLYWHFEGRPQHVDK